MNFTWSTLFEGQPPIDAGTWKPGDPPATITSLPEPPRYDGKATFIHQDLYRSKQ